MKYDIRKNKIWDINIELDTKQRTLQETYPELLIYWDYEKNEITPNEIAPFYHKRIHWKCRKCGHIWEKKIEEMLNRKCPNCEGK
jgi:rubrerythrin